MLSMFLGLPTTRIRVHTDHQKNLDMNWSQIFQNQFFKCLISTIIQETRHINVGILFVCHFMSLFFNFFLFFYYYFLVDLVRDQNIYIIMYIVIHFTFILYRLCDLISVALFSVKRNMAPINILSTSTANFSIFFILNFGNSSNCIALNDTHV